MKTTKEEYLKAKKIVEQYEEQELLDGVNSAMYCVECQALKVNDCFCDEESEHIDYCHYCSREGGGHYDGCEASNDPYDMLLLDGYD